MKIRQTNTMKMLSEDKTLKIRQRLRLQRFGMALTTYIVVIFATFLVTNIGLGYLTNLQWVAYIGLALCGNIIFFLLFYTGANLSFSDPSLTREQILFSAVFGMVALYSLPEARPIVLLFYLPAFSFGMLRLTRQQYLKMVLWVMVLYATILCLEYYNNSDGFKIQYELFIFALYSILLTWFAFFGGFVTNIRQQIRVQKEEIQKANEGLKLQMEIRQKAESEKDELIIELQDALHKVKTLRGLLPICSSCKKIRDDNGYWNQLEAYIQKHSDAEFSHGICPECAKKFYPEIDVNNEDE